MWTGAQTQHLSGGRLHLTHGPIDVVLKAWGTPDAVASAQAAAVARFQTVLGELAGELEVLRAAWTEQSHARSPVGRRMVAACRPFSDRFLTPMIAVAGSVADEVLAVMLAAARLDKAYVNDGGDIAVHVGAGQALRLGIAGDFQASGMPTLNGSFVVTPGLGIGGVATSGARGRSFSLGIADSVTVLARCAADADVAASLIANAVDIECQAVQRMPACALDPDSDLGERLVTVSVGPLTAGEIALALNHGLAAAEDYRQRGLIQAAALMLKGRSVATPHTVERLKEDCA